MIIMVLHPDILFLSDRYIQDWTGERKQYEPHAVYELETTQDSDANDSGSDNDTERFMITPAKFTKFWYAGEEGEARRLKAVEAAAANTGRSKHDEIVDEEEVNESRSGGDNGKRAIAWNYFKLQSQKHHKNKEGDLQFTSSGAKIMKMKMECTLPKAGCMDGKTCGEVVTVITGSGTTPMLNHLRLVSSKGAKAGIGRDEHTAAINAHNASSCNASSLKDDKGGAGAILFKTFQESFASHVMYSLMVVTTRATGNMSNNPEMRGLLASLDPKYRPPCYRTRQKITMCIHDTIVEAQIAKFARLKEEYQGEPTISVQHDMWTNTDTKGRESYGCINITSTSTRVKPNGGLEIAPCDEILAFEEFHPLTHSGDNISNWLQESLESRGINTEVDIVSMTIDGAANGIKAMESLPGIDETFDGDVCLAHDQQRALLHAFGMSTSSTEDKNCKNPGLGNNIMKHKGIVGAYKQSIHLRKTIQQLQKDQNVKVMELQAPCKTRWNGWHSMFKAFVLRHPFIVEGIETQLQQNKNALRENKSYDSCKEQYKLNPNESMAGREFYCVFKKASQTTTMIEGSSKSRLTPEQVLILMHTDFKYYREGEFRIMQEVKKGDTKRTFITKRTDQLHPHVKKAVQIYIEQLNQRVIQRGIPRALQVAISMTKQIDDACKIEIFGEGTVSIHDIPLPGPD